MKRLALAVLACLLFATPANARWRMAESENFVIYADDEAADIQLFADKLERYHQALEFITTRDAPPPSPSSRLTIYVVGNQREVARLASGSSSSAVAGFYVPRASGSIAIVQDIKDTASRDTDFSMIVLLHEYAHHFMMSGSRRLMPRWYNEGMAEFLASANFPADGGVQIGRPAIHRWNELFRAREVDIEELLDDELYRSRKRNRYDAFYGRAWLLYHYLFFSAERAGQLAAYEQAISSGTPQNEASAIFGDLRDLDRELNNYQRQRRMTSLSADPKFFVEPQISITEVSNGMDAILPLLVRSKRGVNREQAEQLLPDIREMAASYYNDAGILAALAEAEYDAGNDAEAIAAADAALALDPTVRNAYVQKGFALFRQAKDAEDAQSAYNAAMKPFEQLNALEADHPLPLIYYYRSFTERSAVPNENARHALERASQLAPFDHSLALTAGMMQASEGKIAIAYSTIAPIAANPHGGQMAEIASQFLEELKEAAEGEPLILQMPEPEEEDGEEGEDSSEED